MGGRIKIHRKGYVYNIQSKSAVNQIFLKILSPIWNEVLAILSGNEEDRCEIPGQARNDDFWYCNDNGSSVYERAAPENVEKAEAVRGIVNHERSGAADLAGDIVFLDVVYRDGVVGSAFYRYVGVCYVYLYFCF